MKCNEINSMLSLYIDRMLEDSQAREIEEHLAGCEACRKEYNEMREIVDLLSQTETIPVPDAFSFRLKRALREEKQSRPAKKKNQWRVITSVAAVFAVGVISLSMYNDVLGTLPEKPNGLSGNDQLKAAETEEYTGDSLAKADSMPAPEDSSVSSDGSVMIVDKDKDKNSRNKTGTDGAPQTEAFTYGVPDQSAPDATGDPLTNSYEDSAGLADIEEPQEAMMEIDGNTLNEYKTSSIDCSRSLASVGIERNSAAVQYYNKLIEEMLAGFDYQILESIYIDTGEWHFRVFIFRGKDGNTYNEEVMICGKEGEIAVISPNDHTEYQK